MAFSFGFTNEELSDEESTDIQQKESQNNQSVPNALKHFKVSSKDQPKQHSLSSILSSLVNVRLSFDNYTTPNGNVIYRRELFDVKHQIMSEDNDTTLNDLLINENHSDLQSKIYEGGFKSWECSYDTVDKLSTLIEPENLFNRNILEFGCGTALPSCFVLLKKLQFNDKQKMSFTLSDFNYDVIRLVTVPNIIIHWASTLTPQELHDLTTSEEDSRFNNDELLITNKLIQKFTNDMNEREITFNFISGSWGQEFLQLIKTDSIDFIISSETIYSPEILPIVAESLKEILKTKNSIALIAAKNIYFGVGGSIVEFLNYFSKIDNTNTFSVEIDEISDSQLKRSIISMRHN